MEPTEAPRTGLGPSTAARRAGALAATIGLAAGFGGLFGTQAPTDIRYQVIGRTLRVRFRGGPPEVALEVGDHRVAAAAGEARFALLPEGREVTARLVWPGGATTPTRVRAEAPALTWSRLAARGRALLEVGRPVEVSRDGVTWTPLAPGAREVAVPEWLPETLRWRLRDREVISDLLLRRDPALRRTADRLLAAEEPAWFAALRARKSAEDAGGEAPGPRDFVTARAAWRGLAGALPQVFAALGDGPAGPRLFARLGAWRRAVAAERLLGDFPPGLAVPPGTAGGTHAGDTPEPAGARPVLLDPADGRAPRKRSDPRRIMMIPGRLRDNPAFGRKSLDYATRVVFPWPRGVPAEVAAPCLTLDVDRLPGDLALRARLGASAAAAELFFHHPDGPASEKSYRGLLTACLPAALAPPVGAPVALELLSVLTPAFDFGGVKGGRITWFERPTHTAQR